MIGHAVGTETTHAAKTDRMKFTDGNDERLIFLSEMATMFKTMDSCKEGTRINTLTGVTRMYYTLRFWEWWI